MPAQKSLSKHFPTVSEAVNWLYANSGLWAGMTEDDQVILQDDLTDHGQAVWCTPLGVLFVATVGEFQ